MKRIIMISLLLAFSTSLISQEIVAPQDLTREDYLRKSRGQRTGAIVLVTTGGVLYLTAGIVAVSEASRAVGTAFVRMFTPDGSPEPSQVHQGLINGLFIVGTAAILGSIPLFVAASRNKKTARSMTISFKPENTFRLQSTGLASQFVPSISLKIRI